MTEREHRAIQLDLDETEASIELLRQQVETISRAVKSIENMGMSRRAILALLADAIPGKIPRKTIDAVLGGMERLHEHVFPSSGEA